MKSVLIASVFSLVTLSLSSFALADASHHHSTSKSADEMHGHNEEHASAIGKPGDPKKVTRTMTVDMNDNMKFSPAALNVKKGETVKFVVKNSGKTRHEMVLGSMAELKKHAAMMKQMPEMEHADANMVTVEPGKTGEIIWQFSKAGKFDFACLQPGHFEAGMKGQVVVK